MKPCLQDLAKISFTRADFREHLAAMQPSAVYACVQLSLARKLRAQGEQYLAQWKLQQEQVS